MVFYELKTIERFLNTLLVSVFIRMQIDSFKNTEKNNICFLFGNGPSLNDTDLCNIEKWDALFGVNSIFKGMDKLGLYKFKYYLCNSVECWDSNYDELINLDTTMFVTPNIAKNCDVPENIIEINCFCDKYINVISCALDIVLHLGFKTVYLLGIDHNYNGWCRWNDAFGNKPSDEMLNEFEGEFKHCSEIFKMNNREIYNSTVGSNLDIFPHMKISDIVREKVY